MKFILRQLLILNLILLIAPDIFGQSGMSEYDSVAMIKPKEGKNLYKFFDYGTREIQFLNKNPKLKSNIPHRGLRDMGNGAMTLITGLRYNSEKDGYWEINATIKCNDTLPDWNGSGILIEGNDTIGSFLIILSSRPDT